MRGIPYANWWSALGAALVALAGPACEQPLALGAADGGSHAGEPPPYDPPLAGPLRQIGVLSGYRVGLAYCPGALYERTWIYYDLLGGVLYGTSRHPDRGASPETTPRATGIAGRPEVSGGGCFAAWSSEHGFPGAARVEGVWPPERIDTGFGPRVSTLGHVVSLETETGERLRLGERTLAVGAIPESLEIGSLDAPSGSIAVYRAAGATGSIAGLFWAADDPTADRTAPVTLAPAAMRGSRVAVAAQAYPDAALAVVAWSDADSGAGVERIRLLIIPDPVGADAALRPPSSEPLTIAEWPIGTGDPVAAVRAVATASGIVVVAGGRLESEGVPSSLVVRVLPSGDVEHHAALPSVGPAMLPDGRVGELACRPMAAASDGADVELLCGDLDGRAVRHLRLADGLPPLSGLRAVGVDHPPDPRASVAVGVPVGLACNTDDCLVTLNVSEVGGQQRGFRIRRDDATAIDSSPFALPNRAVAVPLAHGAAGYLAISADAVSGVPLEARAVTISGPAYDPEVVPAVAPSDIGALAAFALTDRDVRVVRIRPTGGTEDAARFETETPCVALALARGEHGYLLAWVERGRPDGPATMPWTPSTVYAAHLDRTGDAPGPALELGLTYMSPVSVAWSAGRYLVVWTEEEGVATALLDEEGALLRSTSQSDLLGPASTVGWRGGFYLAAARQGFLLGPDGVIPVDASGAVTVAPWARLLAPLDTTRMLVVSDSGWQVVRYPPEGPP